jgi:hypothetical protein
MRYPFLNTARALFKFFGWVVLLLGIATSITFAVAIGTSTIFDIGLPTGVVVIYCILGILYSVITWVVLLAIAELIRLFVDLEEHTRRIAGREPLSS